MQPYWEPASCRSPVKTPRRGLASRRSACPLRRRRAARTEAEAVLLETLRLEEMERRRRSLRTGPLVLSYRNSETGADATAAAGAQVPDALSEAGTGRPGHSPGRPSRCHSRKRRCDGRRLSRIAHRTQRSGTGRDRRSPRWRRTARPLPVWPLSLALVQLETETPVAGLPSDPAGWDRIYEGSFLEAVLVTQLSGDFPGPVLANVSVPFYSVDRQRVLIPRGARVVGGVQAVAGADQERLAVAFHRLIWPDVRTVSLQFNGLNQIGESALKDAVNRHYFSMFAAAGAVGILSGLTAIGSNPYAGGQQGFQAGASQGLGETAVRILDRFLNRLPTITIRAGHRLRIWFTGDVLVPPVPQPTGGIQ